MRECRSTLRVLTGTLAGAEVAKQERVEQLFTDGTKRRQIDLENILIGYFSENGFRTIVLDSAVIPEEEDSESIRTSLLRTFDKAGDLLDKWRAKTAEMYPNEPELLECIPT